MCINKKKDKLSYPASSSSFDPEPVLVGRSSSGNILELLLLPSIVVSANLFVCAIFSIMEPPAVKSDILCFRAARCFLALVRSALRVECAWGTER